MNPTATYLRSQALVHLMREETPRVVSHHAPPPSSVQHLGVISRGGYTKSPSLSSLQGFYLGGSLVRKTTELPLHFGASGGFQFDEYQKSTMASDVREVWETAKTIATEKNQKEVTPAMWLIAMVKGFQSDIDEFKQFAEQHEAYYSPASYLGQMILGADINEPSLGYLTERQSIIDAVNQVGETLQREMATGDGTASVLVPNAELSQIFQLSQGVQDGAFPNHGNGRVTEEAIFWLISELGDSVSKGAIKQLFALQHQEKPIWIKSKRISDTIEQVVSTEGTSGSKESGEDALQDVSAKVRLSTFKPYPIAAKDLNAMGQLIERKPLQNLLLIASPQFNVEQTVLALAHKLNGTPRTDLKNHSTLPMLQLNVQKVYEEALVNLSQDKVEPHPPYVLARLKKQFNQVLEDYFTRHPEHERAIVYLKGSDPSFQMFHPEQIQGILKDLGQKFPVQFILAPSLKLLNGQVYQYKQGISGLYPPGVFRSYRLSKPPVDVVSEYLRDQRMSQWATEYPGLVIPPDAVTQAVKMAAVFRGEDILKKSIEFLDVAATFAKGHQLLELTPDVVDRAVKSTDGVYYTLHRLNAGEAQLMSSPEIDWYLSQRPHVIVPESVEKVFKELDDTILRPDEFKALGITKLPRTILLAGASGTAKTDMVYSFSKRHGLDMMVFSGRDFELGHEATMEDELRRTFSEAKNLSRQDLSKPVVVLIDNTEATARGEDQNPIFGPLLEEMKEASKDSTVNLMTFLVTNHNQGIHPLFLKPPDPLIDRVAMADDVDVFHQRAVLESLFDFRRHQFPELFSQPLELGKVARILQGFSGRQLNEFLDQVVREYHRDSSPSKANYIEQRHVDFALRRILMGGDENVGLRDKIKGRQLRLTAYHELGHAITSWYLSHYFEYVPRKVDFISVIPQGRALGVTIYDEVKDHSEMTKQTLLNNLISVVAGGAIERLVSRDTSLGVSGDQNQAHRLLDTLVSRISIMGGNPIAYGAGEPQTLPPELHHEKIKIYKACSQAADAIAKAYMPFVDNIVDELVGPDGTEGQWTMEGEDFIRRADAWDLANGYKVRNKVHRELDRLLKPIFPEYFGEPLYPEGSAPFQWVTGMFSRVRRKPPLGNLE